MSIQLDNIELHNDMEWVDEFDWTPVQQTSDRTLTGKLIIQEANKQLGRPITLVGGTNAAWHTRSTIKQLALKLQAGKVMTLNFHGVIYAVVFRHNDTPIEAKPILRASPQADDDVYSLTLRLMQVAQ